MFATHSAKSAAPLPPSDQCDEILHSTPSCLQKSMMAWCSSLVSVMYSLIPTTTGTPNLLMFAICFSKFLHPLTIASTFSAF